MAKTKPDSTPDATVEPTPDTKSDPKPGTKAGAMLDLSTLINPKVSGTGTVLHKPGSEQLDKWPLLVYAPSQHGPGIRCDSNGASVEEIAVEFAANSNPEAVAKKFRVSVDHVTQAVDYAVTRGFLGSGKAGD